MMRFRFTFTIQRVVFIALGNLYSNSKALPTEAFKLKLCLKHQKQIRVQVHSMIPIGKRRRVISVAVRKKCLFSWKEKGPVLI